MPSLNHQIILIGVICKINVSDARLKAINIEIMIIFFIENNLQNFEHSLQL